MNYQKRFNTKIFTLFLLLILPEHSIMLKLNVDVFYSPLDKRSQDFLRLSMMKVLETDVGPYIDIQLFPIVNCKLVEDRNNSFSCYLGVEESVLSLEQLCAYNSVISGRNNGNSTGKNVQLKDRILQGVSYVLCTFQGEKELNQRIQRCRKKMSIVAEDIEECKKDFKLVKKTMKEFEKIDPMYHPFLVINNKQSKDHDKWMLKHFGWLLCKLLYHEPNRCQETMYERRKKPEELMWLPPFVNSPEPSSTCTIQSNFLSLALMILFF